MPKEFKEEHFEVVPLNLTGDQADYLRSQKNKSKFARWVFDNLDPGFKKYLKEQDKKEE